MSARDQAQQNDLEETPSSGDPQANTRADRADPRADPSTPEPTQSPHRGGEPASSSTPGPTSSSVWDASSVWSSESNYEPVPAPVPSEAPSFASTRATLDPSFGNDGREFQELHGRARRLDPQRPAACGCRCRQVSRGNLGPRGPGVLRCGCPMCGHSSTEHGHGCHFRVQVSMQTRGTILCEDCSDFCLGLLRWGDRYYENGRP